MKLHWTTARSISDCLCLQVLRPRPRSEDHADRRNRPCDVEGGSVDHRRAFEESRWLLVLVKHGKHSEEVLRLSLLPANEEAQRLPPFGGKDLFRKWDH